MVQNPDRAGASEGGAAVVAQARRTSRSQFEGLGGRGRAAIAAIHDGRGL